MLCFINNRNYMTWPKAMVEKLQSQGHEVIIIDNASTYQPLLDWYAKNPCEVVMLDSNIGHTAPWDIFGRSLAGTKYVVSDPDLDISALPHDWSDRMLTVMRRHPGKVGLTLDDHNIPPTNPAWIEDRFCDTPDGYNHASRGEIIEWIDDVAVHARPTDTTFCLCSRPVYTIDGVRIGAPYMARHNPWHIVPALTHDPRHHEILIDDEIRFYFDHANRSSMTKPRLLKYGMITERASR